MALRHSNSARGTGGGVIEQDPRKVARGGTANTTRVPEFDGYAQDYQRMLQEARASSSVNDYFSRYKVRDLRGITDSLGVTASTILDFGSGIGKSIPHFREYFPGSKLFCADVSGLSLEISGASWPGKEIYCLIGEEGIPLDDSSIDVAFSACVFHHISRAQHLRWLRELHRIVRIGGLLVIFEHNPWNPLTRRVVNRCELDRNAVLLPAPALAQAMRSAGWRDVRQDFRLFFPPSLLALSYLERLIHWLPVGAQYSVTGIKPLASSAEFARC